MSGSRKRSRWGGSSNEAIRNYNNNDRTTTYSSSSSKHAVRPSERSGRISTEDAIRALESEAHTAASKDGRDYSKKSRHKDHRRKDDTDDDESWHRRGRGNHSESRRPRRDDENPQREGDPKRRNDSDARDSYYGPASVEEAETSKSASTTTEKHKPDFGLSGALSKDRRGGNMYKGVLLKFREPPEARAPNTLWRLYVFKGQEQVEILHIARQSAYLIGRNEDIADICIQHSSCSSQHAVLQYRALPNKETRRLNCMPYIMDLESTNGTFLNGVQIDPARYYQLRKGDVIKFGASTREYVLLTADAAS